MNEMYLVGFYHVVKYMEYIYIYIYICVYIYIFVFVFSFPLSISFLFYLGYIRNVIRKVTMTKKRFQPQEFNYKYIKTSKYNSFKVEKLNQIEIIII